MQNQQGTQNQRTLFEIARDIAAKVDILGKDGARDFLLTMAHEYLFQVYGSSLLKDWDGAIEWLTRELKPCEHLITSTDIARVAGSELAFMLEQRPKGGDLQKIRDDYVHKAVYGVDPLTDSDSVSARMAEMTKYLMTWADFPAFGFGIRALDNAFGGILPGEICILTGSPGTMKTSLALCAVDDFVSRAEGIVYYCSVDMAPREITMRLMERESETCEIDIRAMVQRQDSEFEAIRGALHKKYDGRLVIKGHSPTRLMTLEALFQECRKRGPQLVVIDYLTRLKEAGQSDLEFIESAMPAILKYAHTFETSFLILSQMSRASRSEQGSGRVGGHGRGGGLVEELAHTEIELVKQDNTEGGAPYIIACLTKARHGMSGQFFGLDYIGNIKKFTGSAVKMTKDTRRVISNFVPRETGGYYDRMMKK